jgi:hypothetical protein
MNHLAKLGDFKTESCATILKKRFFDLQEDLSRVGLHHS